MGEEARQHVKDIYETHAMKKKSEEVQRFVIAHYRQKMIDTVKDHDHTLNRFILIAVLISVVHMCNVALNFGMNNMVGSLYLNTFILSLAELADLAWKQINIKK